MTAGELPTGAQIGRYVIVERVGTGAMGVVYGAYDPQLDRKVALKLIKPGQGVKDTARARLLREAKAIARLQHPNVVAVHDVGVIDEQVFLAMEFVAGGTIKSWLAEKQRSWREILDVFIAAGRGLAAAHAAGLVHRDFKPDNVLLDNEQRPRVVDFGIARQAGGGEDALDGDTGDVPTDGTATLRDSSGKHALATLTKTGTWVGTPAYMAPEQFLGERGDEKSDQFSFCVALYEALYGERPFAGDDMLSISVNVTTEQLRPLPRDRGVPAWIRRVILRGLKVDPAARRDSMAAVIAALSSDPVAKLRNRLFASGVAVGVIAVVVVAWQMVSRRRAESERQIAAYVEDGRRAAVDARGKAGAARELRRQAFAAFDATDRDNGEASWRGARAYLSAIDGGYDRAERDLDAARMLDPQRKEIRSELADLRYEHFLFAEDFRLETRARILEERLTNGDDGGDKRNLLGSPGTLELHTKPGALRVVLERYDRDPATGRRNAKTVLAQTDAAAKLAAGSYRLLLDGPGLAHVIYPFEIARGERVVVDLTLPAASAVPDGFAFVPAGDFWFGDADEQLRTQFLGTVPIHRRHTDAYLIARDETTYGEWIAFLDSLPPSEQARLEPDATSTSRGSLKLRRLPTGSWQFTLQPTTHRYVADAGEPIVYEGRKQGARQDWSRFPVAGVSPVDANRYISWLQTSGRLPGARMCTELEWERAARGADDRLFPHGDALGDEDANFDVTYGRLGTSYGPDVVGAHVLSRSPFDIDDMAGNAFELALSSQEPSGYVIRGGAYYFNAISSRSTNREPVPPTVRDVTTGLRLCSTVRGDKL